MKRFYEIGYKYFKMPWDAGPGRSWWITAPSMISRMQATVDEIVQQQV